MIFFAGIKDPLQASYHVRHRSFEAVVNGGWFGVGIGNSLTKVTSLPVPPTDSIYAVVIEELGWFGGVGLIVLFGALVWRGLVIARRAPDMLGLPYCFGFGHLDRHRSFDQHGCDGGVAAFCRERIALCKFGRLKPCYYVGGVGHSFQHFPSGKRHKCFR